MFQISKSIISIKFSRGWLEMEHLTKMKSEFKNLVTPNLTPHINYRRNRNYQPSLTNAMNVAQYKKIYI